MIITMIIVPFIKYQNAQVKNSTAPLPSEILTRVQQKKSLKSLYNRISCKSLGLLILCSEARNGSLKIYRTNSSNQMMDLEVAQLP